KNRYLMHNNGARNLALESGRSVAKWVLPWDGNCFLTQRAWSSVLESVVESPHLRYFVVPMQRITDNSVLLADKFEPSPIEEPQLIFRRDATETFSDKFPYGRRPKVELFCRLGIPGKWDRWQDDPWDVERGATSREYG